MCLKRSNENKGDENKWKMNSRTSVQLNVCESVCMNWIIETHESRQDRHKWKYPQRKWNYRRRLLRVARKRLFTFINKILLAPKMLPAPPHFSPCPSGRAYTCWWCEIIHLRFLCVRKQLPIEKPRKDRRKHYCFFLVPLSFSMQSDVVFVVRWTQNDDDYEYYYVCTRAHPIHIFPSSFCAWKEDNNWIAMRLHSHSSQSRMVSRMTSMVAGELTVKCCWRSWTNPRRKTKPEANNDITHAESFECGSLPAESCRRRATCMSAA